MASLEASFRTRSISSSLLLMTSPGALGPKVQHQEEGVQHLDLDEDLVKVAQDGGVGLLRFQRITIFPTVLGYLAALGGRINRP